LCAILLACWTTFGDRCARNGNCSLNATAAATTTMTNAGGKIKIAILGSRHVGKSGKQASKQAREILNVLLAVAVEIR